MLADITVELSEAQKPYHAPRVVHELTLETRAGSPLIVDPSIDPLGLDPTIQ